jgi:type I restriction enzyme S subunit
MLFPHIIQIFYCTLQLRIVAKVDELFALCDALRKGIGDSQTIKIKLADTVVEQTVN